MVNVQKKKEIDKKEVLKGKSQIQDSRRKLRSVFPSIKAATPKLMKNLLGAHLADVQSTVWLVDALLSSATV